MDPIHGATKDVALHAVVHVASAQVGLADLIENVVGFKESWSWAFKNRLEFKKQSSLVHFFCRLGENCTFGCALLAGPAVSSST